MTTQVVTRHFLSFSDASPNASQICKSVLFRVHLMKLVSVYGLDDRVQFLIGVMGIFSLCHHVHTACGAHSVSYPVGTRDFFPGVKVAGA
jgi:hypothetical protein